MSDPRNGEDRQAGAGYWVDRKGRMSFLYRTLWVICAVFAAADFFFAHHPMFKIEGFPVFYGLFGFIVTIGLVLGARELRRIVRRDENYYDR
ncbi:MAG: hypothetical protein OEO83_10625 [Alphaproteobacteria bacterium]|nr:hypothetical protein [Alphaproteobacteria bacterium]